MNSGLTGRLERGTTDKETVNVGLLGELTAVFLIHGAAVEDSGSLGNFRGNVLGKPFADASVSLLSLLSSSNLAGTNSPKYTNIRPISRCRAGSLFRGPTKRARRQSQRWTNP